MNTRSLIFFSFLAILVFPQYAFSVDLPSPSSNGTGSGSTNNATSNPPPTGSTSSNSSLTGGTPSANNTSQKTNNASAISPNSTSSSITNKTSSVTITPNPAIADQGLQVTFSVKVVDTSSSPTVPTGTVSWSDGNAGGTFSQVSCALSSGNCTVSYTPDPHHTASITIAANYGGDDTHLAGAITRTLTINIFHDTTTTVTPNVAGVNQGSQVTLTAKIADTSKSPTLPIGTVSWNDNA